MDGIKRELFAILSHKSYLNTCSAGPLSTPVKQAALKFIEDWDEYAGLSWSMVDKWMDQVEQARSKFAKIIGAKKENIAYMFGNSSAIASIMSSFKFSAGDEIIFNDLDFPAIPANIMAHSVYGTKYVVAKSNGKTIDMDAYRSVISDKTRLITACEVVSNTGFRMDPKQLVDTAHEFDIPVFLDTYQSTGAIPIDVRKLDLDFLATGTLKYLLGGFGISFLYVRDEWLDLLPGSIGWMGVDNPFEDLYDKLRTQLYRPDSANRFQFGTPYPNGAYTANAGMDLINNTGINRIYSHNTNLTGKIIDNALERGYTLLTPEEDDARGSIVNIQLKNSTNVVKLLKENNFVLDERAGGVRISVHFFNNYDDIDNLFSLIDNIIQYND